MRQIRTISWLLASAALLAGSADAQMLSGSGGTVTTDVNGSTAVGITATANPASNVKVTLGANSTSAFHIFTSSNTELFRVQSNGNVGIGTSSPNGKLDIATGSDGITIGQRSDNIHAIQTYIDGHWTDRAIYANGCCTGLLIEPDAGWVAIGTANPTGSYKLEVAGWIYSSAGGYRFPDNTIQTTAASSWIRNSSLGQVSLSTATDRVGIGTATPNRMLDISSPGSDGITLGQQADNAQAIQTYIDGHWTDRSSYANGCCNLLLLEPDAGYVGIATSSPSSRLEIGTTFPVQFQDMSTQGIPNGFLLNMAGNGQINVAGLQLGQTGLPVIQSAGSSDLHLNQFMGANVVIGNSGNTTGLQVQSTGVSTFAGSVTVAHDVTVTGTIYANYQDVAEWVPAAESLSPGTVVVLSDEIANTVTASKQAYDTGVAGVVSPSPGLLLGIEGPSKAKIATTGRVRVRVDATQNPIRMGDLLVTSDRPGMAMKSQPLDLGGAKIHRPGTLIGKALEPLPKGEGEILVLLSLQ